jgi:competence protein ComEC
VPPALALLAGVGAGVCLPCSRDILVPVLLLGFTLAALCLAEGAVRLFVTSTLLATLCGGWLLAQEADARARHPRLREVVAELRGSPVGDATTEPVWVSGTLAEDCESSGEDTWLTVDVRRIGPAGGERDVGGRVRLGVAGATAPAGGLAWAKGRAVRLPALLRRPARYLNPGVPDNELTQLRRGIVFVGRVKSGWLVSVTAPGHVIDETAYAARQTARAVIDRDVGQFSARSAGIVRAILIGDRTALEPDVEDRLQQAGTYHVVAISGGNIAILATIILLVTRLTGVRRPWLEAVTIVLLAAYAWFVGGGASVLRATLMAATVLGARAFDHRSPPLNALAVAGGVGLALRPLAIFDPGAWLTYGASLAILVGAGVSARRLAAAHPVVRAGASLLLATLAAELALFPVSAFVFSRVTAAGLVVNFAAIPLMAIVQGSALVMFAVAPFSAAASGVAGHVAHLAAWGLVESGRFVELAPWLVRRLPAPAWSWMVGYYSGWVLLWAAVSLRQRIGGVVSANARTLRALQWCCRPAAAAAMCFSAGAGLWIVVAPPAHQTPPRGTLRVSFFDVGQGDAALVQCPDGHSLLVDAGGAGGSGFDIGGRVIEPALWARGVRRLTFLVITHGDADHMAGAARVVRDFRPREVWEGVPVPRHEPLVQLRHEADLAGSVWRRVRDGDQLMAGAAEVWVRHPPLPDWERQRVRNDDSVVLEIRYLGVSIVLPGDVESAGEQQFAASVPPARFRVLQVPHHGSATSSGPAFFEAMRPGLVVVSAGRGNRFGHPHRPVLDLARGWRVPVLRTDRDGAITVTVSPARTVIETCAMPRRISFATPAPPA